MLTKKQVDLGTPKNKKIDHNNDEIEVRPYLTLKDQFELIAQYISNYFEPSSILDTETDYVSAESGLMIGILELCTNIDLTGDALAVTEMFTANMPLYNEICDKIENYWDFREKLMMVVSDIKESNLRKDSIGRVIQSTIDKFLAMEITDETLSKVKEMLKEVNESPILKETLNRYSGSPKPAPSVTE